MTPAVLESEGAGTSRVPLTVSAVSPVFAALDPAVLDSGLSGPNLASLTTDLDITVYFRGDDPEAALPAPVFGQEAGGEPLTQPLVTDASGRIEGQAGQDVWVEQGSYDLLVEGQTFPWEAAKGRAVPSFDELADVDVGVPTEGDLLVHDGGSWAKLDRGGTGEQLIVRSDGTVKWTTVSHIPVEAWGAVGNGVADDTTPLQSAIDAAFTNGSAVWIGEGTFKFSALSLAGKDHIRCIGAGWENTKMVVSSTTGNAINMTDTAFCSFSHMTFRQEAERTSGAIFYLDHGAGSTQRNMLRNLRFASCYRAIQLDDCSTTIIENIQLLDYKTEWKWHSLIHLSGAATSTILNKIIGGSGAEVEKAAVFIDGGTVDTVICAEWDLLNQTPSAGMTCLLVESGQWIRVSDCSLESGTTKPAIHLKGGHGIGLSNNHLLGINGLTVEGAYGISVTGGEIVACERSGIALTSGSHVAIVGVEISNVSRTEKGGFHGVSVAANFSDFTIMGCDFGKHLTGGENEMGSNISIAAGTSDRYRIMGNIYGNFKTSAVADAGSGTDKIVQTDAALVLGGSLTIGGSLNFNGTFINLATASVLQYSDVKLSRSTTETMQVDKKLKVGGAFGANGKAPVTPTLAEGATAAQIRTALIEVGIVK